MAMSRQRGMTMVDEAEGKTPLSTLDDLPPTCGFSTEEIIRTLEENKLVEHHILWADYLGDNVSDDKNCVNLDVLLPNGVIYPTVAPLHWTLNNLKTHVCKFMKRWVVLVGCACVRMPNEELSKEPADYIFYTTGDSGETLELYDEERTLNAVQMFLPVLTLREPADNAKEKELNKAVGKCCSCCG